MIQLGRVRRLGWLHVWVRSGGLLLSVSVVPERAVV